MRRNALCTISLVASMCFVTLAAAEDWGNVNELGTCHAVTMDDLEFHDCRRSFALRQIDILNEIQTKAVFATVMGSFDQNRLLRLLSLNKDELNDALPAVIESPEENAAMIRSSYPELVEIAFEANHLFMAEAIKVDDQDAIESAEWFDKRLNLRNDGFSSFCSVFLDDPECQTVTFGDAFPEAPVLDEEQLASAS